MSIAHVYPATVLVLTALKVPPALLGPDTDVLSSSPQQSIESAESIAQVWNWPALTDLNVPPAWLGPLTRLSWAPWNPQQLIESSSASIAHVC